MQKGLFLQAILKFILGAALAGLLLFLPAGTLAFTNGWLLMGVLFIPMFIVGIVMFIQEPALLEKRLQAKEPHKEQTLVVKLSGLMFLLGFILAGLNFRFGWYMLPKWVSIIAVVVFLFGYLLYAKVLQQNAWLSRTIQVQEGQTLVKTGVYGIVRHPMYTATLALFLTMPLILGSLYAFLLFLVYPFLIAKRIRHEEQLLEKKLEGYTQYQQEVKYRLIPFVW